MTAPRQLPLSRLGHLIPPLVESQALVALVPTTADLVWAAKAAWDIARIARIGIAMMLGRPLDPGETVDARKNRLGPAEARRLNINVEASRRAGPALPA